MLSKLTLIAFALLLSSSALAASKTVRPVESPSLVPQTLLRAQNSVQIKKLKSMLYSNKIDIESYRSKARQILESHKE